jgi:hypothetical protein
MARGKRKEKPAALPVARNPARDEEYVERNIKILRSTTKESENEDLHLGRAGEMFVAAQLVRLGFNAAPLPVDTGVDLLAHRQVRYHDENFVPEQELYQFQVKTTSRKDFSLSPMPVKKVYEFWLKSINLIVVFWPRAKTPTSIVLPPSLVYMLTSGGFKDARAPIDITRDLVTIRFIEKEGRYYIRNQKNEITPMLNRFDRIEPAGEFDAIIPCYAGWSEGPGLIEFISD